MEGRKFTKICLTFMYMYMLEQYFVFKDLPLCVHGSHIQVMSFFNQMEGSLYISVAYARALKFTFYILTVSHIGACIWFPLGCYSQDTYELFPTSYACRCMFLSYPSLSGAPVPVGPLLMAYLPAAHPQPSTITSYPSTGPRLPSHL